MSDSEPWRDAKRGWKRRKREWSESRRAGAPWTPGAAPPPGPVLGQVGRRFGWRVWFLPLFLWPLFIDIPISILAGHGRGLVGAALGIGLAFLAASRMARGRAGDAERGSRLLGVAAGLTAGLAAGFHPGMAVALGFGAYFGARLITDDLPEAAPPPPPEPAREPPAELAGPAAQLARVRQLAPSLPESQRLLSAADAMAGVLDDLLERPHRVPEARRFLAVHLDGLSRIAERLEAGAAAPPTLPDLLDTLAQSATRLREDLRRQETEALDIQVKVMSDRLKQEGL